MIHVPNEVLRRAIILPKDIDGSNGKYASPRELLPKNPDSDMEHIMKVKNEKMLMADLIQWQKETFPWHRKKGDDKKENSTEDIQIKKPKKNKQ